MSGSIQTLLDVLAEICDEKGLKVAISGSLKAAMMTGASTFIGALFMGKHGIWAGALVGSLMSTAVSDDFMSVSQVLKEMDPKKKERLVENIKCKFKGLGWIEISAIAGAIISKSELKELAIREVLNYVTHDLGLQIRA